MTNPNATTVADGYSRTDERAPVATSTTSAAQLDFDYNDGVAEEYSKNGDDQSSKDPSQTGVDAHLPNPDRPTLEQTHEGEYHDDHGDAGILKTTRATYLFAFCAALNSCNLGYDIGVNTDAGILLQEDMDLSDVQLEVFMGSLNLFAMIGALFAHAISDRFGRRGAFVVAAIGFIFGVIVMACAGSYGVLMFGRTFVGLGVGFGLAIDPMYIAEISQAAHRGQLVTWSEIATNIGIVLGFLSGLVFYNVEDGTAWRVMFGMGSILPACMIYLAIFVMPESPRWLVAKGREDEAKKVLAKVYPEGYNIDVIANEIKESIEREVAAEHAVGWDVILFPTPAFRRMLLVGVGTAMAQQVVGIDAIQYFLVYIIDESGIESRSAQSAILIFLGLIKLSVIFVAGRLFDHRGRRPLFFISLCGCSVALLLLSFNFFLSDTKGGFAVFALATYLAFFSLGMGPGAWLIPAEVFSTTIRAKAMSVATFMNRVTATLMSSTFLSTAHAMSWAGFFLMMAIVCMIVALFLYIYLPETKGRALEDMALYFAEITGDRSILEAEQMIHGDYREATSPDNVERSEEPERPDDDEPERPPPPEDANVVGTMA